MSSAAEGLKRLDESARFFRHAVVLVDILGRSLPRSSEAEAAAFSLLSEWGAARGGSCLLSNVIVEETPAYTGYALEFEGEPTPPTTPTRLTGLGVRGNNMLTGNEERCQVTIVLDEAEPLGRED